MKKIKYIKRNKSLITGRENLEFLHVFKSFPVFIGCTKTSQKDDILADMSISICKDSGIIQLDKVLPLEIVYPEYHSEALGGMWHEHHMEFVKFLLKYNPCKVLEIGGSNGFIAKEYLKQNKKAKWIMVEPTPSCTNSRNLKIIKKYFDGKFQLEGKVDAVVYSHVLEHQYDPKEFIKNISLLLENDGLHIFTVPNLYKYVINRYTNWLNFEHTVFLTEYFIDYTLQLYGFKIIEKQYFYDPSIFYATQKTSRKASAKYQNKYKEYKKMFLDFLVYYNSLIKSINHKIDNFDGQVYLFGAHVFSQILLQMGLKGNILGILDNSKLKKGKRLYGSNLYIENPQITENKRKVAVVLRAGPYQEEVTNQLRRINKNVYIIE